MRIEPIGVALLIFIIGMLLLLVLKKNQKLLISTYIILLISNGLFFIKYSYLQTDINVATWQSFMFMKRKMESIERETVPLETQVDVENYQKIIDDIWNHMTVLYAVSNNATFSGESIHREDFQRLIMKLDNVIHGLYTEEVETNNKLRTQLIELSKLLKKVKGGPGERRILGPTRIVAEFEEGLYHKIINKLDEIKRIQNNSIDRN